MTNNERTIFNSYSEPNLPATDLAIDSRFALYLRDNDFLSADALVELHAARSGPVRELQQIDKELEDLEASIFALKKRHENIKGGLSVYDTLISPIRVVPDDVLENIFLHCIPTTRNARPFLFEAPLLLTLICKKWRVIAYASPQLWTTLHLAVSFSYGTTSTAVGSGWGGVYLPGRPGISEKHAAELHDTRKEELENWLSRSGTLPLSISLYHPPVTIFGRGPGTRGGPLDSTNPQFEVVQHVLGLVARHANRLAVLQAVMPYNLIQALDRMIKDSTQHLPRIQRIAIAMDQGYNIDSPGSPSNRLQPLSIISSPSLQNVSLRVASDYLQSAKVQWTSNLTVLSLHEHIDIGDAHHILVKLPGLQRCSLNINPRNNGGWGYAPGPPIARQQPIRTTIRLHSLETLAVTGQIKTVGTFCRPFETPSLKHIMIYPAPYQSADSPPSSWDGGPESNEPEIDVPYPPESTDSLCVYLSQCMSLRSLTINPAHVLASELQAIFHILPQINNLILDNNLSQTPGTQILTSLTILSHRPFPLLGTFEYNLHPLLRQERMSKTTNEAIPLSQPLLPNLTSLTWNQFSLYRIPDQLIIDFIKTRLNRRTDSNANVNHGFGASTAPRPVPLKDITIRLLAKSDPSSPDILAEVTRHAESVGLTLGTDFSLHVSMYPWTHAMFSPKPQYDKPKVHTEPSEISEDNVIFNEEVTWPLFDI